MPFLPFAIKNRTTISDAIRAEGFKYYGNKGVYGPVYNQAVFEQSQDHILGTEQQVIDEKATCYYASTADFRDSAGSVVTFVDYDRVNIIIDVMERDIVFPDVKLFIFTYNLVDMNDFDVSFQGVASGFFDGVGDDSTVNVSGQSNGLKLQGDISLTLADTETTANVPTASFFTNNGYLLVMFSNNNGISTYSIDSAGALTLVDTLAINTITSVRQFGISTNGEYYFVAAELNGVYSLSVDSSGNITLEDTEAGTTNGLDVSYGQGFLFMTTGNGVSSASIDSFGDITFVDTENLGVGSVCVSSDDNYIYLATDTDGIKTLEIDGSGNFTLLFTETTISAFSTKASSVVYNGYLYVTGGPSGGSADLLHIYSINQSTGQLTYISSVSLTDPYGIYSDGFGNIFVCYTDGFKHYRQMENGTLLEENDITTDTGQYIITGSPKYIFASNTSGTTAVRSYNRGEYNINFTGSGTIFVSGRPVTR